MAANGSTASGVQRIGAAFSSARSEGRAAVIPYLTLGHPTASRSLELAEAAVAGGADLLELGVPFSDPLADGPVIQRATHVALQQGLTVAKCLELAARLRMRRIVVPLIFMGYYNPILAYGEERFCRACRDARVDGLIVPDLPPEEAGNLERCCEENGLALIYLLAPTSTPERIRLVTQRARGFVYLVSVTGTTGTRNELPTNLGAFVSRVRAVTEKPLAVGFGISSPEQAREVAATADGVVVGSAIVRLADRPDGAQQIRGFVSALRSAAENGFGQGADTPT
jgi:tryptophan synthase alpha chain